MMEQKQDNNSYSVRRSLMDIELKYGDDLYFDALSSIKMH